MNEKFKKTLRQLTYFMALSPSYFMLFAIMLDSTPSPIMTAGIMLILNALTVLMMYLFIDSNSKKSTSTQGHNTTSYDSGNTNSQAQLNSTHNTEVPTSESKVEIHQTEPKIVPIEKKEKKMNYTDKSNIDILEMLDEVIKDSLKDFNTKNQDLLRDHAEELEKRVDDMTLSERSKLGSSWQSFKTPLDNLLDSMESMKKLKKQDPAMKKIMEANTKMMLDGLKASILNLVKELS